jgi:RPA family protein
VTPALERRRHTLETMRELIRRLAAAESAGDNNTAAKALIEETAARLASRPVAEAVSGLRQSESALSGSKPGL